MARIDDHPSSPHPRVSSRGAASAAETAIRPLRDAPAPGPEPANSATPPNGHAVEAPDGKSARPSFALRLDEPLAAGLSRVAREQIDSVTSRLGNDATVGAADVHESRKSLKRLRALTRLLRPALGEEAYERENGDLRDAARHLAGARDAEVMVLTLDALISADAERVGPGAYAPLRAHLQAEREHAATHLLADAGPARRAAADLAPVRERALLWLSADADFTTIEPGLRRIYREGRERRRVACRRDRPEPLHEWRKRVKDLRYCAELLAPIDPKRLAKVLARTDRLGEMLGDEHDLSVIEAFAGEHAELFASRAEQKALLKLIRRRRARLRERALRLGGKLYAPRPRRFTARLARGATAAAPR